MHTVKEAVIFSSIQGLHRLQEVCILLSLVNLGYTNLTISDKL